MRYTQRKKSLLRVDKDGTEHWTEYISISDSTLAHEKLCQLEDIEEELGIDLVTLHKALTGKWFSKDAYGRVHEEDGTIIKLKRAFDQSGKAWWYFDYPFVTYEEQVWYFVDYGKTWALTREELENCSGSESK